MKQTNPQPEKEAQAPPPPRQKKESEEDEEGLLVKAMKNFETQTKRPITQKFFKIMRHAE